MHWHNQLCLACKLSRYNKFYGTSLSSWAALSHLILPIKCKIWWRRKPMTPIVTPISPITTHRSQSSLQPHTYSAICYVIHFRTWRHYLSRKWGLIGWIDRSCRVVSLKWSAYTVRLCWESTTQKVIRSQLELQIAQTSKRWPIVNNAYARLLDDVTHVMWGIHTWRVVAGATRGRRSCDWGGSRNCHATPASRAHSACTCGSCTRSRNRGPTTEKIQFTCTIKIIIAK